MSKKFVVGVRVMDIGLTLAHELWKEYFRDRLDRTAAASMDGASIEEAKQRVSEFLTAKYADSVQPYTAQDPTVRPNTGDVI